MRRILTLALLTLTVLAAKAQQEVIYTIHQFVTPKPGTEWVIRKSPDMKGNKLVHAVQEEMEYLGGCPMWEDQIDFPCSSCEPERTDLLAVTGESGDWYQVYFCHLGYTGVRYAQFVGNVPKSECKEAVIVPMSVAEITTATISYVSSFLGYEQGYETYVVSAGPYKDWVMAWGEANMFFHHNLLHLGKMEKGMYRIYATLEYWLDEEENKIELWNDFKTEHDGKPKLELISSRYFKSKSVNGLTETYPDFGRLNSQDLERLMKFAKVRDASPSLIFFRERATGYQEYDLRGSLNNKYYQEGDTPVWFRSGF